MSVKEFPRWKDSIKKLKNFENIQQEQLVHYNSSMLPKIYKTTALGRNKKSERSDEDEIKL